MCFDIYTTPYHYSNNDMRYQNECMSNFKYESDRFKVDANITSTNTLCFIGGAAVGAALAYYFLNKYMKK